MGARSGGGASGGMGSGSGIDMNNFSRGGFAKAPFAGAAKAGSLKTGDIIQSPEGKQYKVTVAKKTKNDVLVISSPVGENAWQNVPVVLNKNSYINGKKV